MVSPMAKRLLDEGFEDFVLLERNGGVGGTWYQNRYPGCECDVPSAVYSFSFEFKADWSKPYGPPSPRSWPTWSTSPRSTGSLCPLPVRRPTSPAPSGTTPPRGVDAHAGHPGETVEVDVVVSAVGMFNDLAWPEIDGPRHLHRNVLPFGPVGLVTTTSPARRWR